MLVMMSRVQSSAALPFERGKLPDGDWEIMSAM